MTPMIGNSAAKAKKALEDLKREWGDQGGVGEFVPSTGSKEDYDKLVAAVDAATAKNESVAALKVRIEKLGKGVVSLAKKLGIL